MNIRTRKKHIISLIMFQLMMDREFMIKATHLNRTLDTIGGSDWLRSDVFLKAFNETKQAQAEWQQRAATRQSAEELIGTPVYEPAEVEAAKVEYVVARFSNGEVVDTFDQRDDALKLIMKHVRQKKAKLMLVAGEGVEPFTLEEMQALA